MLRQICRPIFQKVRLFQGMTPRQWTIRLCSSQTDNSTHKSNLTEESGFKEPVWFHDDDAAKDVIGNKSTEHFSFDPEKGILQEPEDERLSFHKYVETFGESRYSIRPNWFIQNSTKGSVPENICIGFLVLTPKTVLIIWS